MIPVDDTLTIGCKYKVTYTTASGAIVIYSDDYRESTTATSKINVEQDSNTLTITSTESSETLWIEPKEKPAEFKSTKQQYLEYLDFILYYREVSLELIVGVWKNRPYTAYLLRMKHLKFWPRAPPHTIESYFLR